MSSPDRSAAIEGYVVPSADDPDDDGFRSRATPENERMLPDVGVYSSACSRARAKVWS